jgi:hypothetical protein
MTKPTIKARKGGFSVVTVLVSVALLAGIAGTGWIVYQHNKTQATRAASGSSQPTNSSATPASPTQPAITYLDISEWGLKLPLPESIKDVYYTMKGSNVGSDGLPNTAWIGLTSLNAGGCDISSTGPSATSSPVGSIIRVSLTDQDPITGKLYTDQDPGGVTIGDHYYVYISWKNKKCAGQDKLNAIDASLAAAAKGLARAASATNN